MTEGFAHLLSSLDKEQSINTCNKTNQSVLKLSVSGQFTCIKPSHWCRPFKL